MQFDILISELTISRAARFLRSVHTAARCLGIDAALMDRYKPRPGSVLMLYGPGGPDRWPHVQAHPGRVVMWDAGYWDRTLAEQDRKYRVSIDHTHPQAHVMRGPNPGPARRLASGVKMSKEGNPAGPVLLIGNTPKAISIGAGGWSAAKAKEIRRQFHGRRIAYRPKPNRPIEPGVSCDTISAGDVVAALSEASLAVCRHSNVGVDACRLGVPVVTDDGAAAAIYPRRLEDWENQPSEAVRTEFLDRLAWWQWSANESRSMWNWLLAQLG